MCSMQKDPAWFSCIRFLGRKRDGHYITDNLLAWASLFIAQLLVNALCVLRRMNFNVQNEISHFFCYISDLIMKSCTGVTISFLIITRVSYYLSHFYQKESCKQLSNLIFSHLSRRSKWLGGILFDKTHYERWNCEFGMMRVSQLDISADMKNSFIRNGKNETLHLENEPMEWNDFGIDN